MEAAPQIAAAAERLEQPPAPCVGELAALRRDTDEDGGRAERQALAHRPDHWNLTPEPEHRAGGLAGEAAVEHADDTLGTIADDRVGGLRRHRAEVAVGDDEK